MNFSQAMKLLQVSSFEYSIPYKYIECVCSLLFIYCSSHRFRFVLSLSLMLLHSFVTVTVTALILYLISVDQHWLHVCVIVLFGCMLKTLSILTNMTLN